MLEGCVTVLYASVIFGFACFGLHVVNYVDSLWSLLLAMAVVVFIVAVVLTQR
jgi:hypothetical protein